MNLRSPVDYFCKRVQRHFVVRFVSHFTRVTPLRTMSGERKCGLPLKIVIDELLKFAPTSLAESWDNVGLLVKPVDEIPIDRILLTNDLTEDVLEEALSVKSNLIISYHPPIFAPLKKFTSNSWKERIVAKCIRHNIAIFSPHTSWDVVQGGLNDWLASAFKCKEIKPLIHQKADTSNAHYILTVCDARNRYDNFDSNFSASELQLLHKQDYSVSSQIRTFRCSEKTLKKVISLDHFRQAGTNGGVENYFAMPEYTVDKTVGGIGRICTLENRITIKEAVEKLKEHIGVPHVQLALARRTTPEDFIETVAFVAGSGGSLLKNVTCDLKITGEASHHEVLDWIHNGSSVILTNHSNSERGFLHQFKQILAQKLNCPDIQIDVSARDADPLIVF